MFRNNLLFLYLVLPLIMSCGAASNNTGLTIEGNISNGANLKVFFDQYDISTRSSTIIKDAEINSRGDFKMTFEEKPEEGIYRLRIGSVSSLFLLDGSEKNVTVSGALNDIAQLNYSISGSPIMENFIGTIQSLQGQNKSAENVIEKINATDNTLLKGVLIQTTLAGQPEFMAVYEEYEKELASSDVNQTYKDSYVTFMRSARAAAQKRRGPLAVGQEAPDITLPNPDGKEMSLSDYRGKLVLLDFWASWCRPCRIANPGVVEIYNKYKDQGFTVFSVSLDGIDERTKARLGGDKNRIQQQIAQGKQRWIAAIDQDKLTWDGHVSDLKKWDSSAARLYGVSSIPQTYLIGRDGKIVEVNPRYNLESAVRKHL